MIMILLIIIMIMIIMINNNDNDDNYYYHYFIYYYYWPPCCDTIYLSFLEMQHTCQEHISLLHEALRNNFRVDYILKSFNIVVQ